MVGVFHWEIRRTRIVPSEAIQGHHMWPSEKPTAITLLLERPAFGTLMNLV